MDGLLATAGIETPLKLLTSLGIGLLLGLQRQRTPSAKAGLRTFALVAVFGTIAGLVADATGNPWIVATGLVLVGLMIIAAYLRGEDTPEGDSGTTTVIAVLLCYALGVMVWHGQSQLAVAVGIVATALLQFKAELHTFSARLEQQDVTSILQFAILSFVILPLLPDAHYGPYGALNPYHIWLMVVLVSGVSLAGYLVLRLAGAGRSLLLVGAAGGLVSSTATTLVYARQAGAQPATQPVGAVIITTANLMVLLRLAVMCAVVAPGALPWLLPVLAAGLLAGGWPLLQRRRDAMDLARGEIPRLSNPTQLHVALGFGALYAVVLMAFAWLSDLAGRGGIYALALLSGVADIDAITLSSLNLFNTGRGTAAVAATAIGIAYLASVAFKLAIVGVLGGRRMLGQCAAALIAPAAAVALVLAFYAMR